MWKLYILISIFQIKLFDCYFTLKGKCPDKVLVMNDLKLENLYDKWYQVYHYSSDGSKQNNCSTIELTTKGGRIFFNQTRVDLGLFHRFSYGEVTAPSGDELAKLEVTFLNKNEPRRLVERTYPFWIQSTNYKYYAVVYTCQYSELINKHFVYVWVLSRTKRLNEVSKELALNAVEEGLKINRKLLVKDEFTNERCNPKYYDGNKTAPLTFRRAVPITV